MGNRDDRIVYKSWQANQYNRANSMKRGSDGFIMGKHPAVKTTSFAESRRGGYQGPDTRGSIRSAIGHAGGGTPGRAGDYGSPDYRR